LYSFPFHLSILQIISKTDETIIGAARFQETHPAELAISGKIEVPLLFFAFFTMSRYACRKSHGGTALPAFPEVNRRKALARARAASISRLWGTALVAREINSIRTAVATPSTARSKAGSLTFEGFVNPEIFLTNCSAAL
jgi:hypothetical protein